MQYYNDHKTKALPITDNDELLILENDELIILEDDVEDCSLLQNHWKIMIVDDDRAVHQATQLALKNFVFEGKYLSLIHAFSEAEARELIQTNMDTAFILLDVVMETNDAGLNVVRYIRNELENRRVQIVLRTGQPGDAPEESVILNYDINDYKLKVELTRQRLITTVISALRAYRNVIAVEEKTTQLTQALKALQNTQLQLVQSEKMSALGNLVAGVAHEMNNPLGFISASLKQAKPTISDVVKHLKLYQESLPNPGDEIIEHSEEIDLDYSLEDLPKMIDSMVMACDRLKNISTSLRTFSRADKDYPVPFNVHEGIDSTILILKHRLKANEQRPAIEVTINHANLPQIDCFPGQLNQVFMNILANAIDALEESNTGRSFAEIQTNLNRITITTSIENKAVRIAIADNGKGMSELVKQNIFDHLFTTKAVGKGTGLGLAIARQIVESTHGGKLSCDSALGKGTEFIIEIPL
jgi:signal transduction histidine kinase